MAVALFGGTDLILVGDVEADAKTGEYHAFTASVTNYALESGAVASDHIFEVPDVLEVSFVISNLDDGFGQSYGLRAATILDALRTRIKQRRLWQVVTRHRLYESVAITSVRAEHISPFTGALRGRLSFQEVPLVTLERVKLPAAKTRRKGAASKTNAGRVEAKEPAPRANDSFLSQIRNNARN